MRVEELMTRNVKACTPGTDLAEVAAIMWDNDCGSVPVVDANQRVVGMITDRDISIALATKRQLASDIPAGELINGKVHACTANEDVKTALDRMRVEKVRRLPVVNQTRLLEGILSINDIIVSIRREDGARLDLSNDEILTALEAICEHRVDEGSRRQTGRTAIA